METLKLKKVFIVLHSVNKLTFSQLKERILKEADRLFCQFGIKSITMEELAKELGISKKTIYLNFENKDDLVMQWAMINLKVLEVQWEECTASSKNAIDEVFIFLSKHMDVMIKMNPLIIHDLVKYHPDAISFLRGYRARTERERVQALIKRGMNEGLFRPDLDWEMLSRYQLLMKDQCMNQENFPPAEFNVFKVIKEVTINFLTGMSTLKGYELIEQYRLESALKLPQANLVE